MVNVRNMITRDKLVTTQTHARFGRGNEQIRKLTEVHGGMQRVRQIPPGILQSFQKRNDVWDEFEVLKRIGEQAALHRAKEGMKADGDLGTEVRWETVTNSTTTIGVSY